MEQLELRIGRPKTQGGADARMGRFQLRSQPHFADIGSSTCCCRTGKVNLELAGWASCSLRGGDIGGRRFQRLGSSGSVPDKPLGDRFSTHGVFFISTACDSWRFTSVSGVSTSGGTSSGKDELGRRSTPNRFSAGVVVVLGGVNGVIHRTGRVALVILSQGLGQVSSAL